MGTLSQARDAAREPRSGSFRVALLGLAGAALLGVTVGMVLHLSLSGGGRSTAATPLEGQAVWAAGRVAAPDFSLRDQRGQLVSLRAQHGQPIVLAFMDSRCHQVCPLEGRVLARALGTLPAGTSATLLVVSVDPWADTSSSAASAGARWGFAGSWHWLLGTRSRLAQVWRSYRIYVRWTKGDIVHSDAIYVIDKRGFERAGFLFPFLPGPLQRDLVRLSRERDA